MIICHSIISISSHLTGVKDTSVVLLYMHRTLTVSYLLVNLSIIFFFFFEIKVIKGTLSETFCFTSTVYWNPWETTINYPSHDNISTIVSQSQEKSKRRPWLCLVGQNLLSSSSPLLNCNVSATVISIMAYCQTAGYFTGKRLRFGYGIWEHSLFRVYIQFSECDLSAFWLKKMHLVWRPVFFLGFTIADDTCIKRNAL